jgi:histidine triad (HIT) family protein
LSTGIDAGELRCEAPQHRRPPRGLTVNLARVPDTDPNCIFCKVVAGEIPGEEIDSDDRTLTVMDINPATRGHAVVITRAHAESLVELGDEDMLAAMHAVQRVIERMRATLQPAGFNVLHNIGRAAWQSIFHVHVHVIPRYENDPLQLPWLPEPADPAELAKVADEIRDGGAGR